MRADLPVFNVIKGCTCTPSHAFSPANALREIEVDINKKQIINEQTYKNEIKHENGILNPILQTVILLFKVIMSKLLA